jgi:hypothetical protein
MLDCVDTFGRAVQCGSTIGDYAGFIAAAMFVGFLWLVGWWAQR